MKALSAIIAIIMLLLITVALAGSAYVWIVGTTTSLTATGTKAVTQTTTGMLAQMKVESAAGRTVYVRNTGKGTIENSSLAVYIDDLQLGHSLTPASLAEGQTGVINLTGLWQISLGKHTLKLTTPNLQLQQAVEAEPHSSAVGVWKMDEENLFSEATWSKDGGITQITNTTFLYNGKPTLQFDGGCCRFWLPNSIVTNKKIVLGFYTSTGGGIEMRNSYGPSYSPPKDNWQVIVSSPCSPPCYAVPPAECSPPCRDPLGFGRCEVSDFNVWIVNQRVYIGYAAVVPTGTDASKVTTTIKDASSSSNIGTLFGGTTSVAGKFGSALSFDGVDDYVLVLDNPSLDFTNAFTLVAWIYPTGQFVPDSNNIISKFTDINGVQSNFAYLLDLVDGKPRFLVSSDGSSWQGVTSGTKLQLNRWTMLVGVLDKTSIKIYIDNTQDVVGGFTGNVYNSLHPLKIGFGLPGQRFNGIIDNAMVFNKALTPDETVSLKLV